MAGIDTMTPYRDPREEFRRSVLGERAGRPAAPVGDVYRASIPVGAAQPLADVPADFKKAGINVPGAQATPARGIGQIGSTANAALDADVGAAASKAAKATGGAATSAARKAIGSVTRGLGRLSVPVTAAMQAAQTANTGTDEYYQRTGIDPTATVVPQLAKDIGVRALGTLQDVGNNVTFGVADRVGNLIAGNGFNRSPQYADGAAPAASAAPSGIGDIPQASYSNEGRNRPAPVAEATAAPAAGTITFDPKTKTYSGADVKAGAEITGGAGRGRGTGRGTVTELPTPGVDGYLNQLANIRALGPAPDSTVGQGPAGIGGGTVGSDLRAKTDAVTPSDIARLARGGTGGRAQAAVINQAQQQAIQAAQGERTSELTARGQDIGAATQQANAANQRDIATMQGRTARDVAKIGADARTDAAETRGTQRARYTPIQLPDEVGELGAVRRMGTALLNNETGEIVYPGQNTGAKQQFTQGQVYTDAKGNKATWDGTKFVPVK